MELKIDKYINNNLLSVYFIERNLCPFKEKMGVRINMLSNSGYWLER